MKLPMLTGNVKKHKLDQVAIMIDASELGKRNLPPLQPPSARAADTRRQGDATAAAADCRGGSSSDSGNDHERSSLLWPPSLFTMTVTVAQVLVFLFYRWPVMPSAAAAAAAAVTASDGGSGGGLRLEDSPLLFRPDRREQVWRFLTYMLLHTGWLHLLLNLIVQVAGGVLLEVAHGPWRLAAVYVAGVLSGSLATSLFEPGVSLAGSSGGVYALLAAHVVDVLLLHTGCCRPRRCRGRQCRCRYQQHQSYQQRQEEHAPHSRVRLAAVCALAVADVGFAVVNRVLLIDVHALPVSYTAHAAGACAGLIVGVIVLAADVQPPLLAAATAPAAAKALVGHEAAPASGKSAVNSYSFALPSGTSLAFAAGAAAGSKTAAVGSPGVVSPGGDSGSARAGGSGGVTFLRLAALTLYVTWTLIVVVYNVLDVRADNAATRPCVFTIVYDSVSGDSRRAAFNR